MLRISRSIYQFDARQNCIMQDDVAWIRQALSKDKSKSQKGIADAINVDKSAVSRMLKQGRRLQYHEAIAIADYLGVDLPTDLKPEGLAEDAQSNDESAPIYPTEQSQEQGWLLFRFGAPIDRRPRAPNFRHAASAFGVFAPDAKMAPRFKIGEIAWADPARPVTDGDDVLFLRKIDAQTEEFFLAELKQETPRDFVCMQHHDCKERRLDKTRWQAIKIIERY